MVNDSTSMSFYLEFSTWPDAILRWIQQRNNITFCADLGNITETPAMIKQAVKEESPNSARPKKARQVKSKIKSMVIILFEIKEIVHK
jgi:hypothetical protein